MRVLLPLLFIGSGSAAVVAHYSFDAGYTDSSGNGRHGTLTDVATAGNTFISTDSVFGGGAVDFSDDRDFVAIPLNTFSSGSSWTVAFWAKRDDSGRAFDVVAGYRDDALTAGGNNDLNTDNFLTFIPGAVRYEGNNPAGDTGRRDYSFAMGTAWHHYAYVSNGTTVSVYADGNLLTSTLGTHSPDTNFLLNSIGASYRSTGTSALADADFHGLVDEFWILDEALSSTQVNSLRTTNSVPEPGAPALAAPLLLLSLRRRR